MGCRLSDVPVYRAIGKFGVIECARRREELFPLQQGSSASIFFLAARVVNFAEMHGGKANAEAVGYLLCLTIAGGRCHLSSALLVAAQEIEGLAS